jgi:hypothetical protein
MNPAHRFTLVSLATLAVVLSGCPKKDEPSKDPKTGTVDPKATAADKMVVVVKRAAAENKEYSGDYDGAKAVFYQAWGNKTIGLALDCAMFTCDRFKGAPAPGWNWHDQAELAAKCPGGHVLEIRLGAEAPKVGVMEAGLMNLLTGRSSEVGYAGSGKANLTSVTADEIAGSIDFKDDNGSTVKGSFKAKICK